MSGKRLASFTASFSRSFRLSSLYFFFFSTCFHILLVGLEEHPDVLPPPEVPGIISRIPDGPTISRWCYEYGTKLIIDTIVRYHQWQIICGAASIPRELGQASPRVSGCGGWGCREVFGEGEISNLSASQEPPGGAQGEHGAGRGDAGRRIDHSQKQERMLIPSQARNRPVIGRTSILRDFR